jgi:hypothetical protein
MFWKFSVQYVKTYAKNKISDEDCSLHNRIHRLKFSDNINSSYLLSNFLLHDNSDNVMNTLLESELRNQETHNDAKLKFRTANCMNSELHL